MSKVFEVVMDTFPKDSNDVVTQRMLVTSEDNSLLDVTEHFTVHCEQFEMELKSVSYVADIVQHIEAKTK